MIADEKHQQVFTEIDVIINQLLSQKLLWHY